MKTRTANTDGIIDGRWVNRCMLYKVSSHLISTSPKPDFVSAVHVASMRSSWVWSSVSTVVNVSAWLSVPHLTEVIELMWLVHMPTGRTSIGWRIWTTSHLMEPTSTPWQLPIVTEQNIHHYHHYHNEHVYLHGGNIKTVKNKITIKEKNTNKNEIMK